MKLLLKNRYDDEKLCDNPEMAIMMANQLGYWYFLYAAEVPETSSGEFSVKCYWENAVISQIRSGAYGVENQDCNPK